MIDWQSPEVIEFCGFLFTRMSVIMLGMYIWYFMTTFHSVELRLITRNLKFSWVIVSYLAGRYCLLTTLLMLVVMNQMGQLVTVVCNSSGSKAIAALAVLGNMSLVSASTNLQIRAFTLWKRNRCVGVLLIALCLAQWGFCIELGVRGFGTFWDSEIEACTVDFGRAHRELTAFYLYTVLWDVLILVLTVTALYRQHDARRSPLWSTLLKQGVGYLCITCITNIPMMIMAWLELNYIMVVFFILPGNTISVIASSAAVTSLLKITEHDRASPQTLSAPAHVREAVPKGRPGNLLTTNIELASLALRNSAEVQETRFDRDIEIGLEERRAGEVTALDARTGS